MRECLPDFVIPVSTGTGGQAGVNGEERKNT
jgi:hypothetical protein